MKRYAEAADRCRDLVADGMLDSLSAHEVHALWGECLLGTDPATAGLQLAKAFRIATRSELEPSSWNRRLATALARKGELAGIEYLRAQRDAARQASDWDIMTEIEQLLGDIGEGFSINPGDRS